MDTIFGSSVFGNVEICVDKRDNAEHMIVAFARDENGDIKPDSYKPLSRIFGTREEAMKRFNSALEHGNLSKTVINLINA